MSNELTSLSKSMADAVEKAAAYTVLVDARRRFPASGVLYKPDLVLTALHVVESDEDISVLLPDGSKRTASVAGGDPGSDLVLLRLEGDGGTPAKTAASDPRPGQLAMAVGRPTSEGVQASLGIVSAIGGPARTHRGGMLERYIRTDAIPYPGFSGGPLIDAEGDLIGINTSGLGGGNSVAIPASLAWKIAESLEKHGGVKRGFLGIRSQPVDLPAKASKALNREQETGLLIVGVEDDSPAEGQLIIGDILVALNGQPVETPDELLGMLSGDVVGNPTPVEVLRGGKPETITVTIAERQEEPHHSHEGRGWRVHVRRGGFRGRRGRG